MWPIFSNLIIWHIWLERNHKIFLDNKLLVGQVWDHILGALQETLYAKCDLSGLVDPRDIGIIHNLGIYDVGTIRPKIGKGECSRGKVSRGH